MTRTSPIEGEESDRLSDLPDSVLLHIMEFMNSKDAVHTCLLSKRWKHLWKSLTILTLHSSHFTTRPLFNKFVSSLLSNRDDSISLHYLDLRHGGSMGTNLLNNVITYAASHHIQQLMISITLNYNKDFELPSSLFNCPLTFLKLSFGSLPLKIKLQKPLELPALKYLHLENVTFAISSSDIDNGCVEPFSKCHVLNTLVIQQCYLQSGDDDDADDAKLLLCISNSKLFSLTIMSYRGRGKAYEIMLSTPNLNLLTMKGHRVHRLSYTCDFTCLEEVNIDIQCFGDFNLMANRFVLLITWLQVLANVKIMTLTLGTFKILKELLSRDSIRTQLPCFVRLKSLKLMRPFPNIHDVVVRRMLVYLLHNSPLTRVDIIKC